MYQAAAAINIALCIWILFFGGADKVENTLFGYLEYGLPGEKAWAIRAMAWLSLVLGSAFLLIDADL